MKRRMLSLLLALCFVVGLLSIPTAQADEETDSGETTVVSTDDGVNTDDTAGTDGTAGNDDKEGVPEEEIPEEEVPSPGSGDSDSSDSGSGDSGSGDSDSSDSGSGDSGSGDSDSSDSDSSDSDSSDSDSSDSSSTDDKEPETEQPAEPSSGGSSSGSSSSGSGSSSTPTTPVATPDDSFSSSSSSSGDDSSSSSSSSSDSDSSSTTTKNADGSTTTTWTDKVTGLMKEITKNTDGSVTTVETKQDGTVTETLKTADGTTGTVVTDKNGNIAEVKSSISSSAAQEAATTGDAVTLPLKVFVSKTIEGAPPVTVTLPNGAGSVKVKIPVEKVTLGTVAVIINADGSSAIKKNSIPTSKGVVLSVQDSSTTLKIVDNSKNLIGVNSSDWYSEAAQFVSAREIFPSSASSTFDSNEVMTSGVLKQALSNLGNNTEVLGDTSDEDEINREQMVIAMWENNGCPAPTSGTLSLERFTDADKVSSYAAEAMSWAVETGVIAGIGNNTLAPQLKATKAQAATVITRSLANDIPEAQIFTGSSSTLPFETDPFD